MLYEYECNECHWSFDVICSILDRNNQECPLCKGQASKLMGNLAVTGTRDNFGIKGIFRDDESGKEIDTWGKWEKAGFRDPLEVTSNHKVKENIKRKIKQVKNQ